MTAEQSDLVGLVMDGSVLRRLAEQHWTTGRSVKEIAFLQLVGHLVIHSGLGLDIREGTGRVEELAAAFQAAGILCRVDYGLMSVAMPHICFKLRVAGEGMVSILAGNEAERVHLSPGSIVRLVRFADEALPDIEEKVRQVEIEYDKGERLGLIASTTLEAVLRACGRPFKILKDGESLHVLLHLHPAGKLSVTVNADETADFVSSLEETLRSAELLYSRFGDSVRISELDTWDRWAGPENR